MKRIHPRYRFYVYKAPIDENEKTAYEKKNDIEFDCTLYVADSKTGSVIYCDFGVWVIDDGLDYNGIKHDYNEELHASLSGWTDGITSVQEGIQAMDEYLKKLETEELRQPKKRKLILKEDKNQLKLDKFFPSMTM